MPIKFKTAHEGQEEQMLDLLPKVLSQKLKTIKNSYNTNVNERTHSIKREEYTVSMDRLNIFNTYEDWLAVDSSLSE